MKTHLETLKKCALFNGIEPDSLESLLSCLNAKLSFYKKGETIIAEGTKAKYIGIVLSGFAQIMQVDYYGNKSILSTAKPSQLFGEAFACAEAENTPVTVEAIEDCEIMLTDCNRILKTCCNNCEFHQQLIFNLMKELAKKTIVLHRKIDIISKRTTRDKLMTYLLSEAKKQGRNNFEIPFDRQGLADFLEVDRSGLSAEISKLRNEKIIQCKKNKFRLL